MNIFKMYWARAVKYKSRLWCFMSLLCKEVNDMDAKKAMEHIDKKIAEIAELRKSDLKAALNIAHETLELSKEVNYPEAESILLQQLGVIYAYLNNTAKSIEYTLAAIPLLELYNQEYYLCYAYCALGCMFSNYSYYETAFDYFNKSNYIAKKYQFTDRLSISYNNIGEIYKLLSNYDKALYYYQKSYEEDQKTGFKSCMGTYFVNMADVYYLLGDHAKAKEFAETALEKVKEFNFERALCEVYRIFALIYWKLENPEKAMEYFFKAIDVADKTMAYDLKIDLLIYYHQFMMEQNNHDVAVKALTEAYEYASSENYHEKSILICHHFTMFYEKTGDFESARNYYKLYIMHNQEQSKERLKQIRDGIELRIKTEYIRQQSEVDVLTGIPNRRKFNEKLEDEWKLAAKNSRPLSLIMIDIDCFKEFNDNYGHPEGDKCLVAIAKLMNDILSNKYFLSRYGGDEFMAILPDTTLDQAKNVAESIRKAVMDAKICHKFSTVSFYVTVTQGVATLIPDETKSINDFIRMVDNALYDAKRKGRNMVSCLI